MGRNVLSNENHFHCSCHAKRLPSKTSITTSFPGSRIFPPSRSRRAKDERPGNEMEITVHRAITMRIKHLVCCHARGCYGYLSYPHKPPRSWEEIWPGWRIWLACYVVTAMLVYVLWLFHQQPHVCHSICRWLLTKPQYFVQLSILFSKKNASAIAHRFKIKTRQRYCKNKKSFINLMRCNYITDFPDVTNTYLYVWCTVKSDLLFYEAFVQYP